MMDGFLGIGPPSLILTILLSVLSVLLSEDTRTLSGLWSELLVVSGCNRVSTIFPVFIVIYG